MEREQARALAAVVNDLMPTSSLAQTTAEKLQLLKWERKTRRRARRRYAQRRAQKAGAAIGDRVDRDEIIRRDRATCYLCGKVCELDEIHLDHVVPLSKGGAHTPENVRVACAACNLEKGDALLNDRIRALPSS